jgi:glycosyltransferase involved in cell wall biosynthesis
MIIAMFTDTYWPRVNGITVSVDTYAHALIQAGHTVIIVCSSYPDVMDVKGTAPREESGERKPIIIRTPSLPFVVSNEDRVAKIHKMLWVSKQLETYHPDIVHINSEFIIAEFGFYYAKSHKIPAVYTFHTLWEEYIGNYFPAFLVPLLKHIVRRIFKQALKRADAVIAPTDQAAAVVRRYKTKEEIYVLPTGIDPNHLSPNQLQVADFRGIMEQMYPPLRDRRILLFAGRVTKEKNVGFLLNIAPRILEQHREAVFLIVGDGPYLADLRKECDRLNLNDHCVFTGYLERKDMGLAYAMSDIFVFPSLTETQGLVTVEAMYSGIPVVAIGSMGTIAIMNGDRGGFIVQDDEAEFTARVLDLLEDSRLYSAKAQEAKQYAQNWMIDAMTLKLVEIYKTTIQHRGAAGK